jgi:hypothetical protein
MNAFAHLTKIPCTVGVILLSINTVKRGCGPLGVIGTFAKFGVVIDIDVQVTKFTFKANHW